MPKKVTNGKSNCSNGKHAAVWGLHGETLLLNGSVKTCVTEVGFFVCTDWLHVVVSVNVSCISLIIYTVLSIVRLTANAS